jgi:hypothetical protein
VRYGLKVEEAERDVWVREYDPDGDNVVLEMTEDVSEALSFENANDALALLLRVAIRQPVVEGGLNRPLYDLYEVRVRVLPEVLAA